MQRSRQATEPVAALPWRSCALAAASVSVLLVLLSLVTLLTRPHPAFEPGGAAYRLVNVSGELNVPTWWSVTLLVGAGLTTAVLAALQRANGRGRVATAVLAAGVLALSLDETAAIHERLNLTGGRAGWLVVGVPLALAAAGVTVWLARSLPPSVRRTAVGGMLLLLSSAVGLEALAAVLGRHGWAPSSVPVVLTAHVEELGEMLGATALAVAPLRGLAVLRHRSGVALALAD